MSKNINPRLPALLADALQITSFPAASNPLHCSITEFASKKKYTHFSNKANRNISPIDQDNIDESENLSTFEGWNNKQELNSQILHLAEQEKEIVRNPSSQELDFEEPPNYKNIFKNDLTNLSNGLYLMHQKSIQQNTGAKGFRPTSIRESFRAGQRELTKRASTSQASSLHRQSADLVDTMTSPPQQKETQPEVLKPQEPKIEKEKSSSSPKAKRVRDEEMKTKTEFHRSSYTSSVNKRKQDPNKRLLNNTFIIFSKNNRTTPVNNPHPNMQLYLQMLDRVENSKHKETKIPWSMAEGSSFDLGINSPGYLPAVSAGKKKNIKVVRPPTIYKSTSPKNKNDLNIKLPEQSFENHGQPFEVVMQSTQPRSTTKRESPQKPVLNIIQPISLVSIKDSLSNRLSLKLRSPRGHNIPLSGNSSKEANSLDNSVEHDSSRGASLARGNSDELGPNTIQLEDDLIEPKVPTNPTYLYPTTMPKSGEVSIRRKRRDLFTPYAQLDDDLDYSHDLYSPDKKEMNSFVYTHSPNRTQMRWPSIQKSRAPIIIKEYAGTSTKAADYLSKMSSLSPLLEETFDSKGTRESYKILQKLSKSTRQRDQSPAAPVKEFLIRDGKPQRPIQNVSGLRAEALPFMSSFKPKRATYRKSSSYKSNQNSFDESRKEQFIQRNEVDRYFRSISYDKTEKNFKKRNL